MHQIIQSSIWVVPKQSLTARVVEPDNEKKLTLIQAKAKFWDLDLAAGVQALHTASPKWIAGAPDLALIRAVVVQATCSSLARQ